MQRFTLASATTALLLASAALVGCSGSSASSSASSSTGTATSAASSASASQAEAATTSLAPMPEEPPATSEAPAPQDAAPSLGYTQISQDEAMEMMAADDGHVILDVRRLDEFDAGHIPGAICIPNESIGSEQPAELPDLDQVILIYCRSGNRSKQAAQKLADLGYTNIYEFGGILTWTGEVTTS